MRSVFALVLMISGTVFAQTPAKNVAPPPRSREEVEAILKKAPKTQRPPKMLNILLVAGTKDHGPGEHDYPRWQKEWTPLLSKAENVKIDTAFVEEQKAGRIGWPRPEQWDKVDLAVFYLKTKWDASQLADIKKIQDRGAGVVSIHWAIGCDQEWENHASRFGLSYRAASYRHGKVNLKLAETAAEHPIFLGMPKEMQFVDEPYWPFIGDKSAINVLATSEEMIERGDDRARNPGSDRKIDEPVFWSYEPKDTKGRVFVCIFGHYAWTFDDPFFRLMLLRGMGWAAKDDVYRFDNLAIEGVEIK